MKNGMIKKINRMFLLLLLSAISGFVYAQETTKLNVTIALKIKDGDLKNSLVTITRKDAPFMVLDPGKGENAVDLPLGYEYIFTFTKLGYVSQNIYVDTHVPENREKQEFGKQIFKILLEKEASKDARTNIKIAYSTTINDFDFIKGDFKPEKPVKKEPATATTKVKPANETTTVATTKKQGVTKTGGLIKDKKVTQYDTKKITTIIINIDNTDYTYRKEEYDWGGLFFYKNDVQITADAFKIETE